MDANILDWYSRRLPCIITILNSITLARFIPPVKQLEISVLVCSFELSDVLSFSLLV